MILTGTGRLANLKNADFQMPLSNWTDVSDSNLHQISKLCKVSLQYYI